MEILTAVKGSSKEKRLASQFIARFFKHFPKLADQAIDAHLDLCEDEDIAVSLETFDTIFNVKNSKYTTMYLFLITDSETSNQRSTNTLQRK